MSFARVALSDLTRNATAEYSLNDQSVIAPGGHLDLTGDGFPSNVPVKVDEDLGLVHLAVTAAPQRTVLSGAWSSHGPVQLSPSADELTLVGTPGNETTTSAPLSISTQHGFGLTLTGSITRLGSSNAVDNGVLLQVAATMGAHALSLGFDSNGVWTHQASAPDAWYQVSNSPLGEDKPVGVSSPTPLAEPTFLDSTAALVAHWTLPASAVSLASN